MISLGTLYKWNLVVFVLVYFTLHNVLRIICVVACVRFSFLCKAGCYSVVCLSPYVSKDSWVVPVSCPLWTVLLWTQVFRYSSKSCFQFFQVHTMFGYGFSVCQSSLCWKFGSQSDKSEAWCVTFKTGSLWDIAGQLQVNFLPTEDALPVESLGEDYCKILCLVLSGFLSSCFCSLCHTAIAISSLSSCYCLPTVMWCTRDSHTWAPYPGSYIASFLPTPLVLLFVSESGSYYVIKACLECTAILQPQSPKCRDYKHAPP